MDALGTLRLLEAVRAAGLEKEAKIYQASTSELYGKVVEVPQTEKTPFYPRSPYGKCLVHEWIDDFCNVQLGISNVAPFCFWFLKWRGHLYFFFFNLFILRLV